MRNRKLTIIIIIGIVMIVAYMFVPQTIPAEVKLEVFKSLNSEKDLSYVNALNMEIIHRNNLAEVGTLYKTAKIDKVNSIVHFLGNYKCRTDYNQLRNIEDLESYFIHVKSGNETYFSIYLCKENLSITSKLHPSGPKFVVVGDKIDFNFLEQFVQSMTLE